MIAGGALVGAAAVMVIPQPSKPQQVALASNSGATGTTSGSGSSTAGTSSGSGTTAAAGSATATQHGTAATTRTVVGELETYQYGQLEVKLTITNGKIVHVGFATFVANDGRSIGIDQQAAPILIQETINAQSAQIQGVSGATYTTGAYEQSLQAAIDKAGLAG
jgi:uncharacterized protein with FMN-binding domain